MIITRAQETSDETWTYLECFDEFPASEPIHRDLLTNEPLCVTCAVNRARSHSLVMKFQFNDGGRSAAGYKGTTGDCGVRAIAIATGMPYQEAYDLVARFAATERKGKRKSRNSSPRRGVHGATMRRIMESLGWHFVPTMFIGSGCKVHLRYGEIRMSGRLLVNVSKHFTAIVDGVIHDLSDVSRGGTRCVYGYFTLERSAN